MKKLMVLGAVIITLAAAAFIPVFGTAEGDDFYLRYKDKNMYVLNYEQTTGAGYTVKNTKDEKLFGKSVAVKTLFSFDIHGTECARKFLYVSPPEATRKTVRFCSMLSPVCNRSFRRICSLQSTYRRSHARTEST